MLFIELPTLEAPFSDVPHDSPFGMSMEINVQMMDVIGKSRDEI
jgi:hypothetical protein